MVLTTTVALAGSSAIQQVWLDDHVVVSVPVATNRVTTISFPSPIDAIDGAGITVDGKTPGLFQLAHAKGSAFLSVRAIFPKASANLNIRWNEHTYVFELIESNAPVLSLNMAALPTPEETGAGRAPEVSPLKLLSLLDKAKAFPLLKAQQPESVADVGFTTYDGKPLVSDFNDYQIQIEEAFRFNAEDTLVFRAAITNETDTPLIYQPDSFTLARGQPALSPIHQRRQRHRSAQRPEHRLFRRHRHAGRRAERPVLEKSIHRAGEPAVAATTTAARRHDHQRPRASHPFTKRPAMKPRDFLNFLKTKSGKLVVFGALFAGGIDHFQRHSPASHGFRRLPPRPWPPTASATNPKWCNPWCGPCRCLIRRRPNPRRHRHHHRAQQRVSPLSQIHRPNRCRMFRRIKPNRLRPSVCLPTARRALPARKN